MARMKKSGDGVKKGGGAVIVIAVLAIVAILALGAAVVYLLFSRGGSTGTEAPAQEEPAQRNVLVTPEDVDEIASRKPAESSDADRYTVTMNTTWNFSDGASASSNAYVANSTDNAHPVYFDVMINGDDSPLYESPIIPVGGHIDGIQLNRELENGIYDCVAVYHLVDDEQNTLSTVNVALTINVGNVSLLTD